MSNSLLQYMGLKHESERCRKWLGTICSPKMKASVSHSSSWSARNYCFLVVVSAASVSVLRINMLREFTAQRGMSWAVCDSLMQTPSQKNREKIWEKRSFSIIIFCWVSRHHRAICENARVKRDGVDIQKCEYSEFEFSARQIFLTNSHNNSLSLHLILCLSLPCVGEKVFHWDQETRNTVFMLSSITNEGEQLSQNGRWTFTETSMFQAPQFSKLLKSMRSFAKVCLFIVSWTRTRLAHPQGK